MSIRSERRNSPNACSMTWLLLVWFLALNVTIVKDTIRLLRLGAKNSKRVARPKAWWWRENDSRARRLRVLQSTGLHASNNSPMIFPTIAVQQGCCRSHVSIVCRIPNNSQGEHRVCEAHSLSTTTGQPVGSSQKMVRARHKSSDWSPNKGVRCIRSLRYLACMSESGPTPSEWR